jgi:hypothetical protein
MSEHDPSGSVACAFSVNAEMIRRQWRTGRGILDRQEQQGWGASVISRLSAGLCVAFPDVKGFSARNLSDMKASAKAWQSEEILQTLSAKLPWSHQIALLDKLDGQADRLWHSTDLTRTSAARPFG